MPLKHAELRRGIIRIGPDTGFGLVIGFTEGL
jgi:hypothetical protein